MKPGLLPSTVAVLWIGFGHCASAWAQASPADIPDGTAFQRQCSACHTLDSSAPPRQGPTLAGVYGRKPGTVPGYHYSPGFANTDFVWDEPHLDAYLTNPQAVIPGAIMPYRQSKAPIRLAIITYLKGLPK
jgi:cytochrome c